ncbi:DUF2235 domain-containing protein [Nocardioides jejuensis]|uniref:DUF2235 domain-containing protein n=1 Tax=Nocardioides jejuensis TaxID=2502782 RepID=UPI001A9D1F62|nr:DUF2235 domain-containing protein [Nocardioides jejuensis]
MICLDGTSNEPEHGSTNVARIYAAAAKSDDQLAYYDPGVGTMGARGAVTALGRDATRVAGLVVGFGVKENVEEAYTFLMQHYQRDDRIFVFGFSRGAYTARALTGMLRTVGLLRPGAENLVPYALKLYAQSGTEHPSPAEEKAFWKVRSDFTERFGNPEFPNPFDPHRDQVHFLGVWDTVKSVGWLNAKARWEEAKWPFTRRITNVGTARHALAIDERRRPFTEYRFDKDVVAEHPDRYVEMWFAGVHSDVGGVFGDDHRLSDLAFAWMADEAREAGLVVDGAAYKHALGVRPGEALPDDLPLGRIHRNSGIWVLAGGWRTRPVLPGDHVHPSVQERIDRTAGDRKPYRPALPGRRTRG